MLQRLPIALPQAKTDNTYENLLNEIILSMEQKKLLKKYTTI